MIIGIDPHKSSHTASAVDPATNTVVASIRVDATLTGYPLAAAWAAMNLCSRETGRLGPAISKVCASGILKNLFRGRVACEKVRGGTLSTQSTGAKASATAAWYRGGRRPKT